MALNQLSQILNLVGALDDSPGSDTPRQRFRNFLDANVTEVGQIRDYVQECLKTPNIQYSRALQDLVNHLGHFLGFKVVFGRYQGKLGEIGFDGRWESPTGFHIVIEVKTSEVYPIKTSTLVGYVNELIGEKTIPDWGKALGLYVVGNPNPENQQLENSIVAENRTQQLRVISAESLLSLAELMNVYDVGHADVLALLRPVSPTVDPVVDLITRLVAQQTSETPAPQGQVEVPVLSKTTPTSVPSPNDEPAYWLTPVKSEENQTAEEVVDTLVGQNKVWAFAEKTPGRKHLKQGDLMCFYATTKGVVAHARVVSAPQEKFHSSVSHPEKYSWLFSVEQPKLYLDKPLAIDASVRNTLDAFDGRDPDKSWAWFVQATRRLTKHDFLLLTGQSVQG